MRAIFLDKDGTLISNVPYNVNPALIALAPRAGEGLRLLQQLGYRLFVVSNQDGIAKGLFTEKALAAVQARIVELLHKQQVAIDGFYYCPHHPQGLLPQYAITCDCRKPRPGMLQRAAQQHHIELGHSWMIGDILNDIEAGNRAGCRTVLIDSGNETEWKWSVERTPDVVVPDLYLAACAIAGQDRIERPCNSEATR
jgi:D-glycero-D-manno-heptose 1,7-bisphosphate phosphatase